MSTYRAVMEEARHRLGWIEYAANGRTGLDSPLVLEFGFLQLRMLCELIALGCLVAHGDIAQTRSGRLPRAWSADEILNGLERLHPEAYPEPLREGSIQGLGRHFIPVTDGYMTKEGLLRLYNRECGDALHRGSLKGLLKPRPPIRMNYPEIMEPGQAIANLLAFHRIRLLGGRAHMLCMLKPSNSDKVQVSFAEAFDGDPHRP